MKKNIELSIPNLSMDILDNLKECLESGWVSTGGRFIREFENKIAGYVGTPDAVGIQSGTAGLHTALRVLGIEKNDCVIVPTLTFIAAVNPVVYQGAEPIFMDCDDSLCLDPLKLEKFCWEECRTEGKRLIHKGTGKHIKAVIIVHVFGNMADMEKIMEIGKKYNLKILEDATEALGTYYTEGKYAGKYAGTIGDMGVYSFNANKIITTGGGGMVVSRNQELLDRVRFLSTQAKTDPLNFIHEDIGYNYRMLNLQAALGTDQIERLEGFIETKAKNYQKYKSGIDGIEGLELLTFKKSIRSNYWFYSVLVDEKKYGINKEELIKNLAEESIQTRPIWGLIHQQKPYSKYESYKMEKALWYAERVINIPCSSNLTSEEVEKVIQTLIKFKK